MLDPITIRYPIRPITRSLATGQIADLFGLPAAEPPFTVCENLTVDVRPGDLVLITGASGSGKSSLLREIGRRVNAVDALTLALPDCSLIDALPGELTDRLDVLSAAGLAEARLLLRRPCELSDGQRYRFCLAYALSTVESKTILLDEFTAMLDRPLAKVVAFNLRKLVTRSKVGVLAATTHDDIADDLNPDLHLVCHGDGEIRMTRRDVKKNDSAVTTTCGFRTAPSPIGRTSLGGITAAIISPSSAV